jgi:RNA-directed DNA polymerase
MKVSNVKGLANRDGPESCGGARKSVGEALTGERAGWVLSREKDLDRDADPVGAGGRPQPAFRFGKGRWYPARSETPGMYGSNLRENREILRSPKPARLGRIEKSKDVRR